MNRNLIQFEEFSDDELISIMTAATLITEVVSKLNKYRPSTYMYDNYEDWRILVHFKHSAYNELKNRFKKSEG